MLEWAVSFTIVTAVFFCLSEAVDIAIVAWARRSTNGSHHH